MNSDVLRFNIVNCLCGTVNRDFYLIIVLGMVLYWSNCSTWYGLILGEAVSCSLFSVVLPCLALLDNSTRTTLLYITCFSFASLLVRGYKYESSVLSSVR